MFLINLGLFGRQITVLKLLIKFLIFFCWYCMVFNKNTIKFWLNWVSTFFLFVFNQHYKWKSMLLIRSTENYIMIKLYIDQSVEIIIRRVLVGSFGLVWSWSKCRLGDSKSKVCRYLFRVASLLLICNFYINIKYQIYFFTLLYYPYFLFSITKFLFTKSLYLFNLL